MEKIFNLCDKDITRDTETPTISRANQKKLPCANCGSTDRRLGVGKGPHSASLRCGQCDRFIKWIGKFELAKIENQGGQQ